MRVLNCVGDTIAVKENSMTKGRSHIACLRVNESSNSLVPNLCCLLESPVL